MLCQLRTIGAGIAVLALCFMLASLSSQFLLLGFALASIGWACWSCSKQFSQSARRELPRRQRDEQFDSAQMVPFPTRRRRTRDNLLAFPSSEVSGHGTSF